MESMDSLIYLNFALTFALGVLLAYVTARMSGNAAEAAGATAPDPDDGTARMFVQIRDEVLESVRKDALQQLVRTELKRQIEEVVVDRLARGAFSDAVKQTLDERMNVLQKYVETEVVPRALAARLEPAGAAA